MRSLSWHFLSFHALLSFPNRGSAHVSMPLNCDYFRWYPRELWNIGPQLWIFTGFWCIYCVETVVNTENSSAVVASFATSPNAKKYACLSNICYYTTSWGRVHFACKRWNVSSGSSLHCSSPTTRPSGTWKKDRVQGYLCLHYSSGVTNESNSKKNWSKAVVYIRYA